MSKVRVCGNCLHGHCSTGVDGTEMYCDQSELLEDMGIKGSVCNYHVFELGSELESRELSYDEEYLGPGFFIITKDKSGEITEYLKLFQKITPLGISYAMEVYGQEYRIDDSRFHEIQFIFREQEKTDEELIPIFRRFANDLQNERVFNSSPFQFGISNIRTDSIDKYVFIKFLKDMYAANVDRDNKMNIEFGSIENNKAFQAFDDLFNSLGNLQPPVLNFFDREYFVRTRTNNELE